MEKKDTLSSCSDSEEQKMQQVQDKAKESCMVSFRLLHLHLKLLSNNDLKGTRTECGFKRAFATLFGQDIETFTGTMFLNMDQLEKQLDKEEFQEIGSMAAFKVPETQFQTFIKSRIYLDDEYSIDKRAQHKREYDNRVNDRQMQKIEENVDTSKALDASLVDTESSGTESKEPDTSNRSRNDTHANDADIRPIYNEEPMAEPTAFKSERYTSTKPRFASQVDVNNDLSKPVTTHYFPKEREFAFAKPHHVTASSESRNSSKNMPRFSSNGMVHNHYLEEAKKKTHERGRKSRPSVMPSAKLQSTTNDCKPKPRSNTQTSSNWLASKSSCKCVFNANHDACVTKFLNDVNSHAKTGRIFKTVGFRWVPTGKIFTTSTTTFDSETLHGSNTDIINLHEYIQTLDSSAGTSINVQEEHNLDLSAGTPSNLKKERIKACIKANVISGRPRLHGIALIQEISRQKSQGI
ncbi:hypothetical protein Tco_0817311 [Tanacetum coccineum]